MNTRLEPENDIAVLPAYAGKVRVTTKLCPLDLEKAATSSHQPAPPPHGPLQTQIVTYTSFKIKDLGANLKVFLEIKAFGLNEEKSNKDVPKDLTLKGASV